MENFSNRMVIVGAGPVGLACALAAARLRGISVTVIERQLLTAVERDDGFDNRVYALSPGSRALLHELGVWPRLDEKRIAPILAMQVFGDGEAAYSPRGEMNFNNGSPLAFIVEHTALMNALQGAVSQLPERIKLIDNADIVAIGFPNPAGKIGLTLANQADLGAELLIAADGSASRVRGMAGITFSVKDYDSDGVVANFRPQYSHGGVARQWFSPNGVLAFLPLPGDQVSIVWSVSAVRATELAALDTKAFSAAVAAASNHALGELTLTSSRARVPLRRLMANQWVRPGLALIGDAAHSIHPLAGQGANLGFADVSALFSVLADRSSLANIGDLALLRRYERARREDALAMGEITDNLRSLYLSDSFVAKVMRREGLNIIDRLSATKSMLIGRAIR